jgi:4-alpha-glucanotransferase
MARARVPGLSTLARIYGVQAAFFDVEDRHQQASAEAVLSVLRALGAPVETFADATDALRQRRRELWARGVEPVTVAWDCQPVGIDLRLPAKSSDGSVRCHLSLEAGDGHAWSCNVGELPVVDSAVVEGVRYLTKRLLLPVRLPSGYHRLTL